MPQYLGQHFLINETAILNIIESLELKKGDTIIEIGPGAGALTIPLSQKCKEIGCKLIAIEKDTTLAQGFENVEVVYGDALLELPKIAQKLSDYKIVGNIPYYITGHLLRTIGELANKPVVTVLMIQKEVAQRVCAAPPNMNLLAAATQIWAQCEPLFALRPADFDPPPKVHSAVIKLHTKNLKLKAKELAKYYRALHVIFKQPRKTLLNNLSEAMPRETARKMLETLNLPPNFRSQNATLEHIREISEKL